MAFILSAVSSLVRREDIAYTAGAAAGGYALFRLVASGIKTLELGSVASSIVKEVARIALVGVLPAAVLINRIAPKDDRRVAAKLLGYKLSAKRGCSKGITTADMWESSVKKHGDRVFLRFEDQSLTYKQVDERANQICLWARDQSLKVGDRVCLMMENRPEFIIAWLGLVKLGVAVALINTNLRGDSLIHCIRESGASHFIVGKEMLESVAPIQRVFESDGTKLVWLIFNGSTATADNEILAAQHSMVSLDTAVAKYPKAIDDSKPFRQGLKTESTMFLIYTSGTTGLPKAANFSHLRFLASSSFVLMADLKPSSVLYVVMPLYHSAAGCIAVSAVMKTGAVLVLKKKLSVSAFWKDCVEYKVTHFQYIGEICRYLLKAPPTQYDTAHAVKWAFGNGLRPEIWQEFKTRFNIGNIGEFYGATEGNVVLLNYQQRVGAVGYIPRVAAPFYPCKIVKFDVVSEEPVRDASGFCIECKAGETGEMLGKIVKRDPTTQSAAYTNKEATEKKILRDVFRKGDAWFRTGDLMVKDHDGFVFFQDRIGDTFRWKGENVSTNEVTKIISQHSSIEEVAVYGIPLPFCDGKCGVAAVKLTEARMAPSAEEMIALFSLLAASLPAYARPVFIRIMRDGLQTTGTFKNIKSDLVARGFDLRKAENCVIYVRDDARGTFVPFTQQMQDDLLKGILRF